MRAFVIQGPGVGVVAEVDPPVAVPGEVVVTIERVGVCGTDVELFAGSMAYLHSGLAAFPLRPGHEWCGIVSDVGPGVPASWLGARVTGDTMLGCQACDRCLSGRHHVCSRRQELGISGGRSGALAEALAVPAWSLHRLPDALDATAGALVEPAGCAWRAVDAGGVTAGSSVRIYGTGTVGLLAAQLATARGAVVDVVGTNAAQLHLARSLGVRAAWLAADAAPGSYDVVIDATNATDVPGLALGQVTPAGRLVLVGLAGSPSVIDSRDLVLGDVTAVGILGGSAGLAPAIEAFASGHVRTAPLVAATVGLDQVAAVLSGTWSTASAAPKVQVDPRAA